MSDDINWSVYPRVEKVILTSVPRGAGKDHSDPCRTVVQVFHRSGEFIAEYDPVVNMEKLNGRLQRSEALLRKVMAYPVLREGLASELIEQIKDFFDPEPLG